MKDQERFDASVGVTDFFDGKEEKRKKYMAKPEGCACVCTACIAGSTAADVSASGLSSTRHEVGSTTPGG